MSPYIAIDDNILGGTPCLASTRLSVYVIAARVAAGETAASILDGYPDIPLEAIAVAVEYAKRVPFIEHPDGRPWRTRATVKGAA